MDRFNKYHVDTLVTKFIEFYERPEERSLIGSSYFTKNEDLAKLSESGKQYFLEQVDLSKLLNTIPSLYISKALTSLSKYHFGVYLLSHFPFPLEVNEVDEKGKTVFQCLLGCYSLISNYDLIRCLIALYGRGYQNKEDDLISLTKNYKEINSEVSFEKWCICRFAYLISDYNLLGKAFSYEKVLFTILSFKQKRPIGINYPNLLGVANSALQHYRTVGDVILHAMRHYKVYDDIVERDKKGTFKLKLDDYHKFKPIQDKEFEEAIYIAFPELRQLQ